MRILHICVCGPFTDGLSYQENELIEQHVALGHTVTVIAATDTFGADKHVVHIKPSTSLLSCGATLIRLPYAWGLGGWLATKVRAHRGLRKCMEAIRPERILFHGLSAWSLFTVANYVKRYPEIKLFVDCHEDFNNSAMFWSSRELLHKRFYKPIFKNSISQICEVLCVTVESLDFAVHFYQSPPAKTRLFPLGSVIETAAVNAERRTRFRRQHGLSDVNVVIAQTGKLDKTKRLVDALRAFCTNVSSNLRFVIAGRMTDDVRAECMPLITGDSRVIDLGWQSTDQLRDVLAAADFFLQPFGQTVTTQMAMCHGCVILAQDLPSHRWLVGDKGRLFSDASELEGIFQWVVDNHSKISALKSATLKFAEEHLDYKKLALQIVN